MTMAPDLSNILLNALPNLSVFQPALTKVELYAQRTLHEKGELVTSICFPLDAMVSIVVPVESGDAVEAATVGRDGVVGALAALTNRPSLTTAVVKSAGKAAICPATAFRAAVMQSVDLLTMVLRHEQALLCQSQQLAACNARHTLTERLARWLLRARDLAKSDVIVCTQETIGEMLGVRRTSVSITAHQLAAAGMIKYKRGHISILDVEALRSASCACYEAIKENYSTM